MELARLDQPAVQISSLSHTYKGKRKQEPVRALNGVSFAVDPGEMVAVLGPNGSGKSTLLRVLMTLQPPLEGQVSVEGHDVATEAAAVRRLIGVVFQQPALDIHLKVCENLIAVGRLYGLKGAELGQRVDAALDEMGLTDRRETLVAQLSGGLARRVELAKALISQPRLLIMDEPTTGLDPVARRDFWRLLNQRRHQSGMAVLTTTHLLEEAEACERVAILDRGELLAFDRPENLRLQVGREVLSVEAEDLDQVQKDLEQELGLAGTVVDGTLRLYLGDEVGLDAVRRCIGARMRLLRLAPPSLDDVFLHFTGRSLAAQAAEGETA
jgi:ABC-2 type transport system ATP-binding protein